MTKIITTTGLPQAEIDSYEQVGEICIHLLHCLSASPVLLKKYFRRTSCRPNLEFKSRGSA